MEIKSVKRGKRHGLYTLLLLLILLTLLSACGKDEAKGESQKAQSVGWETIPGREQAGVAASSGQTAGLAAGAEAPQLPASAVQEEKASDAQEDASSAESAEEAEAEEEPADSGSGLAGKYASFGVYLNGQYYRDNVVNGWSVELLKDGTGYLYLGEKHQGPVSAWHADEKGALSVTAGCKTFAGASSIENGILRLDFGDGMVIAFAVSDEVIAGLETIALDG